jgi:hypothetical protein
MFNEKQVPTSMGAQNTVNGQVGAFCGSRFHGNRVAVTRWQTDELDRYFALRQGLGTVATYRTGYTEPHGAQQAFETAADKRFRLLHLLILSPIRDFFKLPVQDTVNLLEEGLSFCVVLVC